MVCIYSMSQTIMRMRSDINLWWHLLVPCSSCCTHPTHETVQDTDSSYNQVMLLLSGSLTFPKWRGDCHFYTVSQAMSPHCLQMSWQRISKKWYFQAPNGLFQPLFDPISSQYLQKVLSSMSHCRFFRFQDVCQHFELGHAHNSKRFLRENTPPSTALQDLAHNPVAFVLISIFTFCCRVSHINRVSGDEKSLASKLI